jgi:hypothetical protein
MTVSPRRRQEIIDALRRGTGPHSSLDAFAVGLERFEAALGQELLAVKGGGAVFKAVRGDYGCGKTFFARWLGERSVPCPPSRDGSSGARETFFRVPRSPTGRADPVAPTEEGSPARGSRSHSQGPSDDPPALPRADPERHSLRLFQKIRQGAAPFPAQLE